MSTLVEIGIWEKTVSTQFLVFPISTRVDILIKPYINRKNVLLTDEK
jgi:hypothetical protein